MNKKIYIEAGANDGIFQSRSLSLKNKEEYLGILIEPVPEVFYACKKNRPECLHYNCALVDFDYPHTNTQINIHHMYYAMATLIKSPTESYVGEIVVPARTLDSILEENNISAIDYFFLDVEGYELNVLKGINFNKRFFTSIEVECHYNLLKIDREYEIQSHVDYLKRHNYYLSTIITDNGHPKLIFNHE